MNNFILNFTSLKSATALCYRFMRDFLEKEFTVLSHVNVQIEVNMFAIKEDICKKYYCFKIQATAFFKMGIAFSHQVQKVACRVSPQFPIKNKQLKIIFHYHSKKY